MPEPEVNGGVPPQVHTPEVQPTDGVQPVQTTPATTEPALKKWKAQLPDKWKKDARLDKYNSLDEAMGDLLDGSVVKPQVKEEVQGTEPVLDYELPKSLSEDIDPSGVFHQNMQGAVKNLKLPKEQAETVYKAFVDSYKKAESDLRTKGAEICEAQLKKQWGEKYESKLQHMQRAYNHLVPKGSALEKGLKDTLAENNPFVVELLSTIGESISEHNPPRSTAVGKELERKGFLARESEKYPWA